MRHPYIAPIANTSGDVVRTTLSSKTMLDETLDENTKTPGGSSLSFGL